MFAIILGLLATYTEGLTLFKRDGGSARVVGLPIQRRGVSGIVARDRLRRRAGTALESLDNEVKL